MTSPYDLFIAVYKAGVDAAKQGKTLQDCPYNYPTGRKLWMRGYKFVNSAKYLQIEQETPNVYQ